METRRWTNPSQPQTLQVGVFLLYATAVFGILFGSVFGDVGSLLGLGSARTLLGFLALIGAAAAGFGIANEKRWAYNLGVVIALLEAALLLRRVMNGSLSGSVISLMFSIALVVLLLHPMSRNYQKLWFS